MPSSATNPPTARQLEILAYMRDHLAQHGTSPTLRRIAKHFGLTSLNGIHDHMLAMAKKGLVARSYPGEKSSPWRPL